MSSKASCQFCSKPDDSIQVVCESRCLLCSRCQFVPAIRRLLLDHTIFQTSPSLSEESIRRTSANPSLPSGPTVASGKCPICLSSLSPSMLALIETFQEVNQTLDDKTTVRNKYWCWNTSLNSILGELCYKQLLEAWRSISWNCSVSEAVSSDVWFDKHRSKTLPRNSK